MNIDEIVDFASERKQESEEVPSRNIGELLLRLYTAGVLLFGAGTAISQEANADNIDNGYEVAQVVNDIDLNEYTKVAEEDGLEFYITNVTNRKPVHNPNKKTKPDWRTTPYRFFDLLMVNNSNVDYTILELKMEAADRKGPELKFTKDQLVSAWGTATIKAGESLLQPDRGAWSKKGIFPIISDESYKIQNSNGEIMDIKISYKVK